MIRLEETIEVPRSCEDVYNYLLDFRTCVEWDATAISAKLLSEGPIGKGSQFQVECALPVGSITLLYTIESLDPDHQIVLRAEGRFFDAIDSITVKPSKRGCKVTYRADFNFKGLLGRYEKQFQQNMVKMGQASIQKGLKRALDDEFPTPELTKGTRLADRLLIPGLSRFTKWGYTRGRKTWNPVSANMSNRHVVLTGATAGLGLAAATDLARRGAHLTLVVRNKEKGTELVKDLKTSTGNKNIKLEVADLALIADTNALISRLNRRGKQIDVLINNAGALFPEFGETSEGLETSFALLLLNPFKLVEGCKPLFTDGSRIINVVSGGMYTQKLEVDKLQAIEKGYNGAVAYARAKRALTVATEIWADEWAAEGIVVNSMHPGWADTPGVESSLPAFHRVTKRVLRSPEEGADTIVWLACATEAGRVSGQLFLDREPHSTHMLSSTQESESERDRLMDYLRTMAATPAADMKDAA